MDFEHLTLRLQALIRPPTAPLGVHVLRAGESLPNDTGPETHWQYLRSIKADYLRPEPKKTDATPCP